MTLEELKTKLEKAEKSISNPMIQSNPAILDAIVKNIEKYKKEISDMEAAAETKVEKAEDKLADAETKAEIKDAKADLKDAKEEKKEVEKAAEKIEKIEDKAEKKQGGIREGSGRPKKMEIKKGDWRKIKSGAGKKAKASSPTKMMKPKSVKIDREPVTEKVKKVRAFGQVVEYKNDSEFCKQLIKAFKKRRKASKKDGKRRKTKPVFGVITTSVKNAVSKALHSVSEKEIEKNPKAFLAKAERLEKSAIRFLEDFKSILGSDYKKSEITSEFGDLEKSIKAFVGKFMDKKYANGGGVETVKISELKRDMIVYPIYGSYAGKKGNVVKIMPDNKTVEVVFKHKVGNDYAKFMGNELTTNLKYANGGGVGDYKITLKSWDTLVYEDDYNEGEGNQVNSFGERENKSFSNVSDFFKYINNTILYYDMNKEYFSIMDDGRIVTSILVDEDNSPASKMEIEEWKKGNRKLYSANYNFYVTLTKEKTPTANELSELLGIGVYKKGGGINSGRDYIFKSQEPHEQRYKRKRDWKEYE
jgi:chemotaxis protein histidine kinase CheA